MGFFKEENRCELAWTEDGLYVVILALGSVSLQNSELVRTTTVAGATVESF